MPYVSGCEHGGLSLGMSLPHVIQQAVLAAAVVLLTLRLLPGLLIHAVYVHDDGPKSEAPSSKRSRFQFEDDTQRKELMYKVLDVLHEKGEQLRKVDTFGGVLAGSTYPLEDLSPTQRARDNSVEQQHLQAGDEGLDEVSLLSFERGTLKRSAIGLAGFGSLSAGNDEVELTERESTSFEAKANPRKWQTKKSEKDRSRSDSLELLEEAGELYINKESSSNAKDSKNDGLAITMNQNSLPGLGQLIVTPWKDRRSKSARTLGKVTKALLSVLPQKDVFSGVRFNTCAVVGSAGILLEDDFGPSIDTHDMVMRFNVAPTKGFERHVGRKTTIRLVNRKHIGYRETEEEVVLQHLTLAEMVDDFVKLHQQSPRLRTFVFDMSFYQQVLSEEHQYPTNGYFGIHLALMLCNKVDVYGFLRNWKGLLPYHYFNSEEPNEKQMPRDSDEMLLIDLLLDLYRDKARFMHPCIIDESCQGCSKGALCDGKTPLPRPRLGHCRCPNTMCFFKCKPGTLICGRGRKGLCVEGLHQRECVPPM